MKNFKFLSFALLFWVLVIAWCEKVNNQEKVSCEGEDVCPVGETNETPSLEIEEMPTVIVNGNLGEKDLGWDLDWNWWWFIDTEWDLDSPEWGDADFESAVVESSSDADKPMMRVMVDEDEDSGVFEITPSQTCEALGWIWNEWDCTLQDGSKVYF